MGKIILETTLPITEWLRPLISLDHITTPGLSLVGAHGRQAKFCLQMVGCFFLEDLPFSSHIIIGLTKNE